MHYNENSDRKQAKTKEGVDRWNVVYPKAHKGEKAVAKKIKECSTHSKHIYTQLETKHTDFMYNLLPQLKYYHYYCRLH